MRRFRTPGQAPLAVGLVVELRPDGEWLRMVRRLAVLVRPARVLFDENGWVVGRLA